MKRGWLLALLVSVGLNLGFAWQLWNKETGGSGRRDGGRPACSTSQARRVACSPVSPMARSSSRAACSMASARDCPERSLTITAHPRSARAPASSN